MRFARPGLLVTAITISSLSATSLDGDLGSAARSGGLIAGSLEVTGLVKSPIPLAKDDLDARPQWTMRATSGFGSSVRSGSFAGPSPLSVIAVAGGLSTNPEIRNDRLRKYIVATGAGGYQVVIAWSAIHPGFGGSPISVATQRDGDSLDESEGLARLSVSGDQQGGRHVQQLVQPEIRDGTSRHHFDAHGIYGLGSL